MPAGPLCHKAPLRRLLPTPRLGLPRGTSRATGQRPGHVPAAAEPSLCLFAFSIYRTAAAFHIWHRRARNREIKPAGNKAFRFRPELRQTHAEMREILKNLQNSHWQRTKYY